MAITLLQTPTTTATLATKPCAGYVLSTGAEVRAASRSGALTSTTSGLAPSYIQVNLIILPSRYASDFRTLCARNPVPCPLIAESSSVGCYQFLKAWVGPVSQESLASDLDIRRDAPKYMVYRDMKLIKDGCLDVLEEWTDDHVAFLIGCSFSFEAALTEAGLEPRHTKRSTTVPMYRTRVPLCASGVFDSGTFVVSMRSYKKSEIEEVRRISRPYISTHGEPIAWGWDAIEKLGIKDIDCPEWGEPPTSASGERFGQYWGDEDEIPVFWGCGVSPQEAVMRANLQGTVMAHKPGCMLLLDCQNLDQGA